MNTAPLARILIVDDEVANMRALCDALGDQGYDTEGCTNGEDALKALRKTQFDLLLTDLVMPGMDGVALLTAALEADPQLVGVLMTGEGTIETAVAAMKAGALDYVLKPIKLKVILPVIARAVSMRRLRLENLELRNTVAIHELNQAMAHTLDPNVLLDKIADTALAQFEADEASVMLLSDDGDFLYVAAVRGDNRDTLLGMRQPLGEGIAGRVAMQREPVVLEGEVKQSGLAPQFPRSDIRSSLCMPMVTRGKLIGVLNVNSTHRQGVFSLGQVKVLSIFTSAAAAGIEAARLHENQREADARYRQVLNMAADAIVSLDEEHRITIFNEAAERIFGWPSTDVLGKSLDILIPERHLDGHRRLIEEFEAEPESTMPMQGRGPFFGRRKDGTEFPAEISISRESEGERNVYTVVLRDVTQRVQQERKIARLSRIQAVLSGINSAIVRIRDRDELFQEACKIAVKDGEFRMAWIGLAESDLGKVRPVSWQGVVDGYLDEVGRALDEVTLDQGAAGRALREKRPILFNDVEKDPDVAFRQEALARGYRSLAVLPLLVKDAPAGVIALYAGEPGSFDHEEMKLLEELAGDVSFGLEVMEQQQQLAYLAHYDVLTGLPNRMLFDERLEQRVHGAHLDQKRFAVIMFNLERFRNINETLGRHVGDAVLRHVGRRLGDAIGENDLLAHINADQFAIATRRIDDEADIARIVEHTLADILAHPFESGKTRLQLAARVGIAVYPADGSDAETLSRNAEAALREAKSAARKYQFYAPHLNAAVAEMLHLENRLRGALEKDEFLLHYQPKVDIGTGMITSLEALIRWQDEERGLVPPIQFIPILEETGLIIDVGRWVMQEALRTAAALRAKGLPSIRIAVNVSPIQLRQKDFVRSVEDAITVAGEGPHGLDIEVTEGMIMHGIEENVRKLNELRGLGVELAIDDFGTGYSSLNYIARFPVNAIKIDRAFIRNLDQDASNASVVRTIITLAHSLQLEVVAEGVETGTELDSLRHMKCDEYQGFFFSKPVTVAEIEQMLLAMGSLLPSTKPL